MPVILVNLKPPMWSEVIEGMMAVLENPKASQYARDLIKQEFRRMAELADQGDAK